MAGKKWSEKDNILLKKLFWNAPIEILCKSFPHRSIDAIKLHANYIGLQRKRKDYRKSDLSVLLQNTKESRYWLGFLFADGDFSRTRIRLRLSAKDKNHLKKYANFINVKYISISNNSVGVASMDTKIVSKLRNKFSISLRKTYNPVDISKFNDVELMDVFIGFIDGDGCISKQSGGRNDSFIRIKCHSSWIKNIQLFSDIAHKLCHVTGPSAYIDKYGYAEINICKSVVLKLLKNRSEKLPSLKRKWNRITKMI